MTHDLKYYVYEHFHPVSGEIVYVGKGSSGRAWSCGTANTPDTGTRRGNRTKAHQAWIADLLAAGYTPADFVRIVQQRMTSAAAHAAEAERIKLYGYAQLFNLLSGAKNHPGAISADGLKAGLESRAAGKPWSEAAKQAGVATMTLWRAANGKTKRITNQQEAMQ